MPSWVAAAWWSMSAAWSESSTVGVDVEMARAGSGLMLIARFRAQFMPRPRPGSRPSGRCSVPRRSIRRRTARSRGRRAHRRHPRPGLPGPGMATVRPSSPPSIDGGWLRRRSRTARGRRVRGLRASAAAVGGRSSRRAAPGRPRRSSPRRAQRAGADGVGHGVDATAAMPAPWCLPSASTPADVRCGVRRAAPRRRCGSGSSSGRRRSGSSSRQRTTPSARPAVSRSVTTISVDLDPGPWRAILLQCHGGSLPETLPARNRPRLLGTLPPGNAGIPGDLRGAWRPRVVIRRPCGRTPRVRPHGLPGNREEPTLPSTPRGDWRGVPRPDQPELVEPTIRHGRDRCHAAAAQQVHPGAAPGAGPEANWTASRCSSAGATSSWITRRCSGWSR